MAKCQVTDCIGCPKWSVTWNTGHDKGATFHYCSTHKGQKHMWYIDPVPYDASEDKVKEFWEEVWS